MACEFEVFITPFCSTAIDDKVMLVAQERGVNDAPNIPLSVRAETELSSRLHHDDAVCEKQTGERSLALSSSGNSGERRCDQEDEGVLL